MGDAFPTGPSPVFPPLRWICPPELGGCGKEHSEPHFPWPKQIDFSKKPGEVGRVKFNRTDDGGQLKGDTKTIKRYLDKQAPMYDKKGKLQPLFCPHCGFLLEGVLLVRN